MGSVVALLCQKLQLHILRLGKDVGMLWRTLMCQRSSRHHLVCWMQKGWCSKLVMVKAAATWCHMVMVVPRSSNQGGRRGKERGCE